MEYATIYLDQKWQRCKLDMSFIYNIMEKYMWPTKQFGWVVIHCPENNDDDDDDDEMN